LPAASIDQNNSGFQSIVEPVVKVEPTVKVKVEPSSASIDSNNTALVPSGVTLKRKLSELDSDSQLFRALDAAGLLDDLAKSAQDNDQQKSNLFDSLVESIPDNSGSGSMDAGDLNYSFLELDNDLLSKDLGLDGGVEDQLVANAINDVGLTFDEFTKLVSESEKPEIETTPEMDSRKMCGDMPDLLQELSMGYY